MSTIATPDAVTPATITDACEEVARQFPHLRPRVSVEGRNLIIRPSFQPDPEIFRTTMRDLEALGLTFAFLTLKDSLTSPVHVWFDFNPHETLP